MSLEAWGSGVNWDVIDGERCGVGESKWGTGHALGCLGKWKGGSLAGDAHAQRRGGCGGGDWPTTSARTVGPEGGGNLMVRTVHVFAATRDGLVEPKRRLAQSFRFGLNQEVGGHDGVHEASDNEKRDKSIGSSRKTFELEAAGKRGFAEHISRCFYL